MALSTPLAKLADKITDKNDQLKRAGIIISTVLLTGVLILSIMFLVGESYNPFIYFRF